MDQASTSHDVEFVDTHVHFWDHGVTGLTWPYLVPGFDHPRLRDMHRLDAPRFTVREFVEQAGRVRIAGIVHVQSAREESPGIESAWIQSISDREGMPDAIVARASVVAPDLDALLAANARSEKFRGVRDMDAPRTIGTEAFTAGFESIADAGLSIELLVPYPSHHEVCTLADRRPDATIVLGHAGLAEHRDRDYFREWAESLRAVARRPNVVVKISALASGADPQWTVESIRPWVEHCIQTFGPDHAMFASNWPIDRMYRGYEELLGAYRAITEPLLPHERHALFAGTARRTYRIAPRH